MAAHPVSPLAPKSYPDLPAIAGVRFATAVAGIKYKNRTDVLLMAFDAGTTASGVLTKSKCSSAAVDWCKANLPGGSARGLVVNSGNANAFTGTKGKQSVQMTADYAAKALGCQPSSSAARRMRSRAAALTPGRLLNTNETALFETPARAATSPIVTRLAPAARVVRSPGVRVECSAAFTSSG